MTDFDPIEYSLMFTIRNEWPRTDRGFDLVEFYISPMYFLSKKIMKFDLFFKS